MLKNRVFEAFGKERNLSKKERNLSRKERNLSREVQDLIFRLKSYGWRTLLFSLQIPFHLAEGLGWFDNWVASLVCKGTAFYDSRKSYIDEFGIVQINTNKYK